MDAYSDRPYFPYSWHQSHDQATVLLMVPYNVEDDDLSVLIDTQHLIIGVKGCAPIVKGRLYGPVDAASSVWQLEPRTASRGRTTSSASTVSTHSSYAFVSDPDISSSFAASLEGGPVSDAEDAAAGTSSAPSPALSSPNLSFADEVLYPAPARRKLPLNPQHASRAGSPGHAHPAHPSMTSSLSSLSSAQNAPRAGRLLTVHLEKAASAIWPALVVGAAPEDLEASIANTVVVFDAGQAPDRYNMDPTSLALIALELCDIRKEKAEAFEYFLRAWKDAHVPSATMRLVSHYLPLEATAALSATSESTLAAPLDYYFRSVGGSRGLAQLYLEAGLLHLEGAASTLLAASYSSLSSIRIPLHAQIGEGGTEAWRKDRDAAGRFFERAHALHPALDIPALPVEGAIELEMPSMHMPTSTPESEESKESYEPDSEPEAPVVRRRRRKEEQQPLVEKTRTDLDEYDNAWYLYIPGIIGAGTALLVVGIVGALSFSNWSRRNQGS